MQDFTPFIPGLPGAFSGPPAVGHLASEVADELCTSNTFTNIYKHRDNT
jgi:hypothetical protein